MDGGHGTRAGHAVLMEAQAEEPPPMGESRG